MVLGGNERLQRGVRALKKQEKRKEKDYGAGCGCFGFRRISTTTASITTIITTTIAPIAQSGNGSELAVFSIVATPVCSL